MNQFSLPTNYPIFLLTVWRDEGSTAEGAALRFSLDDPRSGQRRGLVEPDCLLAFLASWLAAGDDGDPGGPDGSNEQGGADR